MFQTPIVLLQSGNAFSNALYHGISSNNEIKREASNLLVEMALQVIKIGNDARLEAEYKTLVIGACTNLYNDIKGSLNGGVGQQMLNLVYKFSEESMNPTVRKILATTLEANIKAATEKEFTRLLKNVEKIGSLIDEVWSSEEVYTEGLISTKPIIANKDKKIKGIALWDFNRNETPLKEYDEWVKSQNEIIDTEKSKNLDKIAKGASGRLFKLEVSSRLTKGATKGDFNKLLTTYLNKLAEVLTEEWEAAQEEPAEAK